MKNIHIKNVMFCLIFISIIGCNKDPLSNNLQNGSWNIISDISDGMNTIFFIDSKSGWAVGDSGKIKVTGDGGFSWSNQNSVTDNRLVSVYFVDNQTGFSSGVNNTLIYTKNKGDTWESITVASDSTSIYSSLHSDNDNNLYFISNYGEIFYSTNLGQDWNTKYRFNNWGYSYLYFPSNTFGFAMQFAGNEIKKTIDGGNIWNTYQIPSQWTGDICFLNENYGWVTENWAPSSMIHDSVTVYMTTNGGETWVRQSSLPGLTLDNIVFVDSLEGWVSIITKIYYTSNGGKSWIYQFETEDIGFIKDIFFLDNRNGWALTSEGKIIKYIAK